MDRNRFVNTFSTNGFNLMKKSTVSINHSNKESNGKTISTNNILNEDDLNVFARI